MITGSSPIFAVADVLETTRFYKEVLGFTSSWEWGDPPTFGAATWGKSTINFSYRPDLAGKVEGHEHWFDVEDVNALHAQHLERGAAIVSPIEDKPWGKREYTVRDMNGYHLRFAGSPSYTPKGTGIFPSEVEIVRRKPTLEEYRSLVGKSVYKNVPPQIFAQTWQGVVALDPRDEVIGTTRIMYDAPGWFSIWDVAVLPEWQGRRIGTALLEEALGIVREESPGAFVFLFTGNQAFYDRLGFGKESVTMRKV
jgi:GNAT superfamily N-acetyltransferase